MPQVAANPCSRRIHQLGKAIGTVSSDERATAYVSPSKFLHDDLEVLDVVVADARVIRL
jgi:hypothetical protein